MTLSHMGERQLFKALRAQGFTVEENGPSITVHAPEPIAEGISPTHKFHRSSLEHSAFWAVARDLEKMGFRDPEEIKREDAAQKKAERDARVFICEGDAATRFGITCGCGREFRREAHLARHLAALAEKEGTKEKTGRWTQREERPVVETTKSMPTDDVRRVRLLVKKLRAFSAQAEELAAVYEPLMDENEELKRKLQKVEDILGKAIDTL